MSACQTPGETVSTPIVGAQPTALPSSAPSASPSTEPSPVTVVPRPSSAPDEDICAGQSTLQGLDVSDYDPDTQWVTVAQVGRSFAYVKATEGDDFTNPYFASDWAATKAQGISRGAYHYFHPEIDPLSQADYFLSVMGTLSSTDLPAVLDWEETGGLSVSAQIQSALVWLAQVQSVTGKAPVIYVDPSFWNALGNPTQFASYPLYIANYEVTCPFIPAPWSSWTFWQQGTGPIDGVQSAAADLDEFNGSLAQLHSFAANGAL
jgi:lysozyme